MLVDAQIRRLQNFADKFELTVKYNWDQDQRKKQRFLFVKNGISISQPLTYDEGNIFLLGILKAKENNL